MSFFFFFQAEDGIRDYKVTGVQTCALPISGADLEQSRRRAEIVPGRPLTRRCRVRRDEGQFRRQNIGHHHVGGWSIAVVRSEERRVGKECRSRWSPYH